MAKRPAKENTTPEQPEQDEARNTPLPHPGLLKTTTYALKKGTVLHRVHQGSISILTWTFNAE